MDALTFNIPSKKLQGVLQEICKIDCETQENWEGLIDIALGLVESLSLTLCVDIDNKSELEKLVVNLWNKTVVLKTKGNIAKQSYGKLRHIAYQVLSFLNEGSGDSASLKKQIMMGLKATRAWIDVNEFKYAEAVLGTLSETIQKLQRLLVERKNATKPAEDHEKEMIESERDLFCVLCLKSEVNFAQNQHTEALAAVKKTKEMLSRFPNEAFNLSIMCYNFGVDCYQSKKFETGIIWLRESFSISKDITESNPKTEARTLRLLANCYLEAKCDNWKEHALNAVTLANQKFSHAAGIYVRLQLLCEAQETETAIHQGLETLMGHPSFDMNLCMNALRLLRNFQGYETVFAIRKEILSKFERHQDRGSLYVNLLELFLQSLDTDLASTFAEECIEAHATGHRFEGTSLKQLHIFFWMKAAQYFEKHLYDKAVTWYNYSLSLYSSLSVSEPNLAKLQRNLANCYLNLGQIEKAATAIEFAERCDKGDAHTQYIIFKVALEQENAERAMSSLKELVDCMNCDSERKDINIICLAAHTALEKNSTELGCVALECLISNSRNIKQVLTSLKCLLRLLVEQLERNEGLDKRSILCHIRTAYNKIIVSKDSGGLATPEVQEEATWFMKIAWNLALQSKDDPFCLKEFFNHCFQFLSLCPPSPANLQRHQSCLLMSCAACLQMARQPDNAPQMQDLLEEVLHHIEEYKQVETKEQQVSGSAEPSPRPMSTEMFLLLYEFEARTKLKDSRAESILEKALTLPNPSPKLFHTLSVLANDAPANNKRLSVRALKVAIRLHLQLENPDFVKCSADVRMLISNSLVLNEKEAMIYYKETLDVIEKRAKDKYPEMEILWLMTKAWNWGLQHYNCNKLLEAEQWCSLSMSMLKFLPLSREEYQEQMMSVYGEILNRIEQTARHRGLEE